jgi:hypothetical protein
MPASSGYGINMPAGSGHFSSPGKNPTQPRPCLQGTYYYDKKKYSSNGKNRCGMKGSKVKALWMRRADEKCVNMSSVEDDRGEW